MALSGHKSLLPLGERPLIEHLLCKLKEQTSGELIINTYDAEAFQYLELRLLGDTPLITKHQNDNKEKTVFRAGPLQGIYSAMMDSSQYSEGYLITVSCDTPFIPDNLVKRLLDLARKSAKDCAIAMSNQRHHPIIGCWHHSQREDLKRWLQQGNRRALGWAEQAGAEVVDFGNYCDQDGEFDPFFNINNSYDLSLAHEWNARLL